MYQILRPQQIVHTDSSRAAVEVGDCLGGGTQGEVYKVTVNGSIMALKWYFPHYLKDDPRLRERLEMAIGLGPPTDSFLWPLDLASAQGVSGFGYLMPVREPRFKGIVDLMVRRVEPSFRALATACFEATHSYRQLHAQGLCYRDIAFGNIFFDPITGDVRICDNDNVDYDGVPGAINGTQRFMAPEIVRGEAPPSRQTDLFSLAVLLFYMLMIHHPLEGKREDIIHCFDPNAMKRVYGREPVFIFDPDDDSNRPVPERHSNALAFWPLYPQFLRDLFIQSFTVGIGDPQGGRVQEGQWQSAFVRLRDSIFDCPTCQSENFYDPVAIKASGGLPPGCWSCKEVARLPSRIRIGSNVVLLNPTTKLFPHHVDDGRTYDFSSPVAEVSAHPEKPKVFGLKNLSSDKWVLARADGELRDIQPDQTVAINSGIKINFGTSVGEIRAD